MEKLDILVVTPLQKERDQFLKYVEFREEQAKTGEIYFAFEIGDLKVGLFCPARMGNAPMSAHLALLAAQLRPEAVILVGIAGGLGDEVQIGDVVIADQGTYFESQKVRDASIEYRPNSVTCCPRIYQIGANLGAEWKNIKEDPPQEYTPSIHTGSILFGEKVVADSKLTELLIKKFPKSLAVEMEGYGAFQAAEALVKLPRFMIVRGISDKSDESKEDTWQPYAASAAASVTVQLIKRMSWIKENQEEANQPLYLGLRHQTMELIVPKSITDDIPTGHLYKEIPIELSVDSDGAGVIEAIEAQRDITTTIEKLKSSDAPNFGYFGIAHIPLIFDLAANMGVKSPIDLFEHDRSSDAWNKLKVSSVDLPFNVEKPETVIGDDVAIAISISYPVGKKQIEETLGSVPIASISLEDVTLDPISSHEQITNITNAFRNLLDEISPNAKRVHIFYAGPVSLAFALGRKISRNIHPEVWAYNFSRSEAPNYKWAVCVTQKTSPEVFKKFGEKNV